MCPLYCLQPKLTIGLRWVIDNKEAHTKEEKDMIGSTPTNSNISAIGYMLVMLFEERPVWKRKEILEHGLFRKFDNDEIIWVLKANDGRYWKGRLKERYCGPRIGYVDEWVYTFIEGPKSSDID